MLKHDMTVNSVDIHLETNVSNNVELNRLASLLKPEQNIIESSRDLDLLEPEFCVKVKGVLALCNKNKTPMRPFYTVRTPWEQARLWRQSRPTHEIQKAIKKLREEGAPFLAYMLDRVGPQNGRKVTNALPGQSWHQWLLAVDCFALAPNGKAVWAPDFESYQFYAETAAEFGLTAGYYWRSKDAVHLQGRQDTVKQNNTWPEINDRMLELYGSHPLNQYEEKE